MKKNKPIYRYDIIQNSDEWMQERVRRIGASNASDLLMAKTTKGYQNLKDRLVEETITGVETESKSFFGNSYTERGHELEPIAREDFEFRTFESVDTVGIVILDEWSHCSPDGLIGEDILHQIKCPIFNTQKKYLSIVNENKTVAEKYRLSDNRILTKIDSGYYKQLQYELYVSDRKINIWTSYHPNLKAIDLYVIRDEDMIFNIENSLKEIKIEVLEEVEKIKLINK
jgi:hypothetical protein